MFKFQIPKGKIPNLKIPNVQIPNSKLPPCGGFEGGFKFQMFKFQNRSKNGVVFWNLGFPDLEFLFSKIHFH